MNLQDKVALITGAGRGCGRALAVEFARHGARVVVAARTAADLRETAAIIEREDGRCLVVPTDVADPAQVRALVERTLKELGRIDVLFNNAARIPVINGLWEVDADAWWDEVTVNLRGPMLCIRAVLPQMMQRNEGIIINMSGGQKIPGRTSYSCSKAALARLTELLARELAAAGSAVIAFGMTPGLVKTRRTLHEAESPEGRKWNPNTHQQFEEGKDRPPEDCARAAIKLVTAAGPELCGKIFAAGDVLSGGKDG